MKKLRITTTLAGLLILGAALGPAFAGDSFYGKVTEVKSGGLLILDSGDGQMELQLVGIDVPQEGPVAAQARAFVSNLVLGKNARMRADHRLPDGPMLARLFTDDPVTGIREVAVEMVRAGLARRQADYDFKYGELAAAEKDARAAQRGLWASSEPQ